MKSTKIVYNACYGGFSLSEAAMRLYAEKKGLSFYVWSDPKYPSEMFRLYFTADPSGMKEIDNEFHKKYSLYGPDLERTDPVLVEVVEELGDKANGMCAKLRITEIDAGTLYRIDEYDGLESIETNDDIDWKIA
jgi:hypothetical protein